MVLDFLAEPLALKEFHGRVRERIVRGQERHGPALTAEYVNDHLPDVRERVLQKAALAMEGLQILPGTKGEPFFTGNPPAWHENRVQNEQYIHSLNRMQHWSPLLQAYCLTRESRYAQKVTEELRDWIARCPRPPLDGNFKSVHPWYSLEVGIRMFTSWPMVLDYLLPSGQLTPEDLAAFADSVHQHGEVLYTVVPRLHPRAENNHYIMENLGLLVLALNFPEFRESEQWRAHAIRELERCAMVQLTGEGGQVEGCPHYHNICVVFFCRALLLGEKNGLSFSKDYRDRVRGALDYSLHALRPNGTGVPWGDSDADYTVIDAALFGYLSTGDAAHLRLAASLIGPEKTRQSCEDRVWEIRDFTQFQKELTASDTVVLPSRAWFKELKQVAFRTGWTREASSLFFACRTPVNNGHAHIDPMGFDFTARGRAMLVDPGRFTYREDAARRDFKSAAWHNTITINDREPFEYQSTWSFGPQKEGKIFPWENVRA